MQYKHIKCGCFNDDEIQEYFTKGNIYEGGILKDDYMVKSKHSGFTLHCNQKYFEDRFVILNVKIMDRKEVKKEAKKEKTAKDREKRALKQHETKFSKKDKPKEKHKRKGTRFNYLTFNGETRNMKEWAEITGIDLKTISKRISHGWTVERVLTEPKHDNGYNKKEVKDDE